MAQLLDHIVSSELSIGQTLAQCRVEAKLGEEGMGAVYRACDMRLEHQVALKVLPLEHLTDPARRKALMQEARAASGLSHANIVTIYEIGSVHETDFLAMEYVEGQSLARAIPAEGLPVTRALDLQSRSPPHWQRRTSRE